ncbi:hypothetical protein ACKI2C_48180, partial [Streptomyces brasiliscabiei]
AIANDGSDNSRVDYTGATVIDAFETKREQIDYNGLYAINDEFDVSGGLNWYEDDISETSGDYSKDNREVFAGFVGAYYDNERVLANFALRYDDDQYFGNETTYTAAAGYRLHENA